MKRFLVILFIYPLFLKAQIEPVRQDTVVEKYLIIKGDSIPRKSIDLEEVLVLQPIRFFTKEERYRYLILRRKTRKVYPYAKMAAERLIALNKELKQFEKRRKKKKHAKKVQKFIEKEFSAELKKMTKTEGQILVKLIYRQTGKTAFDLVKELRNGWRAFWYNTTANIFKLSLKDEYDPEKNNEDYLIEDVLQRAFTDGSLPRQSSRLQFNFLEITQERKSIVDVEEYKKMFAKMRKKNKQKKRS